jgi:hypothetical protein
LLGTSDPPPHRNVVAIPAGRKAQADFHAGRRLAMTTAPPADLLFLTDPEPKVCVLNVRGENEELRRYTVSRDQLFCLNKMTADILLKDFK